MLRRTRLIGLLAVLVGAVLLGSVLAQPVSVMTITHAETDEPLAIHQIEDGERFELRYVHSFEKTPIYETFEIRDGSIYLIREAYGYHAAGLAYTYEVEQDGDMQVIRMNREIGTFTIRIAETTEQSFVIDGEERPLTTYADPRTPITVATHETTYLRYLWLRTSTTR
ncbi:DUF1850 domain-containing protein [Haloferacaceae archaeon DSL9]